MLNQNAHRGQEWLETFFRLSALPGTVSVEQPQYHDDSCWLTIDASSLTAEQQSLLLGADGIILDSLQYLINTAMNVGVSREEQQAYTVELNGYRLKRQAELQSMAEQAVGQVRSTGREYEFPPLSSAERRQLHTLLKSYGDLETSSRGQEPDRRLVVRPIDSDAIP